MAKKDSNFMSLFWKIYSWFWVSQIAVLCTMFLYVWVCEPETYTYKSVPSPTSSEPLRSEAFFLSSESGAFWRLFCLFIGTETVVCFLSARYLASPTVKLRRATHQLAAGDLTARIGSQMGRRRDELADMGRDFDLMAERIETLVASERRLAESERRTVEAQQQLLADISHELRSPLARIAYALDLAQGGANEETSGYLQRIKRESALLNELIGQLLTLARLEAAPEAAPEQGGAWNSAAPVELSKIVGEVCQDADFEARERGRTVHLLRNEACLVRGKADLLRSAVENVVRNAVRHAPSDSAIEVALCCDERQASITVRDFGAGVPEELLPELFRPFYRVAQARERESGGVGLGLSITDRAIRFHGGKVHAKNASGGGLVVELMLPISQ